MYGTAVDISPDVKELLKEEGVDSKNAFAGSNRVHINPYNSPIVAVTKGKIHALHMRMINRVVLCEAHLDCMRGELNHLIQNDPNPWGGYPGMENNGGAPLGNPAHWPKVKPKTP